MKSVIIFDNEYVSHFCGEIKKGVYEVYDLQKIGTEDLPLYERVENNVNLNSRSLKKLTEKLKDVTQCKLKFSNVIIPHGLSWYHILEVETYPKDENESVEFVMWKVQKIMPIPKDNAELKVQILKREKNTSKILVVVTFKSFIRSLEELLIEQGINPVIITTPTISFLNFFEKSFPKNGVVYWLREKYFSQIIFKDDLPISIREIDRHLEISRIDFETMSILSSIKEKFEDFVIQEIVFFDELERIGLENYFSESVRILSVKDRVLCKTPQSKLSSFVCGLGVLDL